MAPASSRVDFVTAALAKKRLLDEVVCSAAWLDEVVSPTDDGSGQWIIRGDVYPPGGEQTAMRQCPECRRVCPPHGPRGSPCCDCQAEEDWRTFLEWASHPSRHELLPDLLRLARMQAVNYAEFMENPRSGPLGAFAEEKDTYEGSEWRPVTDDDGPPRSRDALARLAIEAAVGSLRRHLGCTVVLLPEDEASLQEEIAYYLANGCIMPRARKGYFRLVTAG
jgi:hypothetical protein